LSNAKTLAAILKSHFMAWNVSSIIINPKADIENEKLLEELGFSNLKKIQDEPYAVAMYPAPGMVYIGTYKDNLIISATNFPLEFFSRSLSPLEEKLISLFPCAEICAVSLNSVVNHWGYAVIKQGRKVRAKASDADEGTALDFGDPLEEESTLYENGQRRYYFENNTNEPYFEYQIGENFVFEIFKKYTGTLLDQDHELLGTNFTSYEIADQSDSTFFDNYFSGSWQGHYIYGDGYSESIKGRQINFFLLIKVSNGEIKGICIDEDKQDDAPATVDGFMFGRFINFLLQYPIHYIFDNNDVVKKDKSKPYVVSHTGIFDRLTESFKGIWNVEHTKCWGEWFMKKKFKQTKN
jgi:hypothetical protein